MKSVILYSLMALLFGAVAVWLIFVPGSNPAWVARGVVWSGLMLAIGLAADARREGRARAAARERSAARAAAWQMVRERIHRAAELDPATLTREIK